MNSKIMYINDLPNKPRKQLCDILDADEKWEELGGCYMKYNFTDIMKIGRALYRDKSPTSELLKKYSERNGTVEHLFNWLYEMDHKRAMSILEPYVDQQYHGILRNENTFSTSFPSYSNKDDIPRPSLAQLSMTSTNNLSQMSQVSSTHKHLSGACNNSAKGNASLKDSKFENQANINESYTSNSMRSKSLNMPHMEPKIVTKISPDIKRHMYSKEESICDNCAQEKIKNAKKIQEMLLNKKQLKHTHLPAGASYSSQPDSLPDFMNVPFSEICKATDNFNEARILGKGGFGIVYKGEWKGASVAIKRLIPKKCDNPSRQLRQTSIISFKQSLNELNILKCCRFDHILPLYAISLDGVDPCLIYQLMVNGSLEDRLLCKNKTPPLTWLQRSHIAECTAKGLNYLHTTYEKPLVHGDIKSANILLDNNMEAKIGDFGLTREGLNSNNTHLKVTSIHGTECYLPEEYLRFKKLSPQVDIFSYGIVMLEIATGLRPFDSQTKKSLVEQVKSSEGSGCLDSLRDVKAGEENMMWFRELVRIGQECSSSEKKKRPLMQKVLGEFKKVKIETSMMDRIRRLSNDKSNTLANLGPNLSPLELQLFHDFKRKGMNSVTEDKVLNVVPDNAAAASVTPLVEQMKNASLNPEETEPSNRSLSRSDSYVSSELSSECESKPSVNAQLMERGDLSADKDIEAESRVPPVPLISILKMKVSEFQDNYNEHNSGKIIVQRQ